MMFMMPIVLGVTVSDKGIQPKLNNKAAGIVAGLALLT